MEKNKLFHKSEFRQDPISGDWVLFAPGRFHKTRAEFRKKKTVRVFPPEKNDIFKNPFKSVNENIILQYANEKRIYGGEKAQSLKDWELVILENKYPAVSHDVKKITSKKIGMPVAPGFGHHDLLITRDYKKDFPELSKNGAFHVFEAFRDRYLMLFADPHIEYVSIFHNWGSKAGASVLHPHYQILGIPLVPPSIVARLKNTEKYSHNHTMCAYCKMIAWEKKQKKRIIAESEYGIAFAPFASHINFQIKIFPRFHRPFFENTLDVELADITGLLQKVLRSIKKNLGDPDYNFYIHTAPVFKKNQYPFFHWHIEIIPRINVQAGFEYATGIFVNVVDPDFAASLLRS